MLKYYFLILWIKKCPKCSSYRVHKYGLKRGKQNYKCQNCKHSFQNNNRAKSNNWIKNAYHKYASGRQTLHDLSKDIGISSKTLRKYFDNYQPKVTKITIPNNPINLIIDATFFTRHDGVLIARANSRNIIWKEIETEKIEHYESLLKLLLNADIKLNSFVIDGRRGVLHMLNKTFPNIPIQLCQFHQLQIITRYLSRNPKLEAGKELRILTFSITKTSRKIFTANLDKWHNKWEYFLAEKTVNDITGKWCFTHGRLRSAYRSLKTNLPYIFTYLDYPSLNIPNTTNSCDGSFAHWKNKIKIHRGLTKERRRKMINYLLENS